MCTHPAGLCNDPPDASATVRRPSAAVRGMEEQRRFGGDEAIACGLEWNGCDASEHGRMPAAENPPQRSPDGRDADTEKGAESGNAQELLENPHLNKGNEVEEAGDGTQRDGLVDQPKSAVREHESISLSATAPTRFLVRNGTQEEDPSEGRRSLVTSSTQTENNLDYVDSSAVASAAKPVAPLSHHELVELNIVRNNSEVLGVGQGAEPTVRASKKDDARSGAREEDLSAVPAAVDEGAVAGRDVSADGPGVRRTQGGVGHRQGEPQETRGEEKQLDLTGGTNPERLVEKDLAPRRNSNYQCLATEDLKTVALDEGLRDNNESRDGREIADRSTTGGGASAGSSPIGQRRDSCESGAMEPSSPPPPNDEDDGDDDDEASFIQEDEGSVGSGSFGKAALDDRGGERSSPAVWQSWEAAENGPSNGVPSECGAD